MSDLLPLNWLLAHARKVAINSNQVTCIVGLLGQRQEQQESCFYGVDCKMGCIVKASKWHNAKTMHERVKNQ